MQNLPLGIQEFSEIRQRNDLYVDKTALIYQLIQKRNIILFPDPVALVNPCW